MIVKQSVKVFVSHSSHDKWAARRIAEDLEKLGCRTFLDEKDIVTGSAIDSAVWSHLTDTDDFVILLSPTSVHSEWVLLELGGALALHKRVIPVLLHVGINDLPKAITLKLARDINELDRYYEELAARTGHVPGKPHKARRKRKRSRPARRFQIGDTIRIIARRPKDALFVGWDDAMDELRTDYPNIRCGRFG
jgi:hypothetical protein